MDLTKAFNGHREERSDVATSQCSPPVRRPEIAPADGAVMTEVSQRSRDKKKPRLRKERRPEFAIDRGSGNQEDGGASRINQPLPAVPVVATDAAGADGRRRPTADPAVNTLLLRHQATNGEGQ